VRRYLHHFHSSGHVWQGRFKAFPIEADAHLRVVLRYIERNPLRADLVERGELWRWSSLSGAGPAPTLDPGPAPRGEGWIEDVNAVMTESESVSIREAIRRDRPLGSELWMRETAGTLGLESSLRERGRPRRNGDGEPRRQ
jgi:putative transposase